MALEETPVGINSAQLLVRFMLSCFLVDKNQSCYQRSNNNNIAFYIYKRLKKDILQIFVTVELIMGLFWIMARSHLSSNRFSFYHCCLEFTSITKNNNFPIIKEWTMVAPTQTITSGKLKATLHFVLILCWKIKVFDHPSVVNFF